MHIDKPLQAEQHAKFLFSKDTEVDWALAQPPIPLEQIKIYPGSIKGPQPEDDPDTYSRWFFENQPAALKRDGEWDVDELGIKKKLIRGERENTYKNEIKTMTEHFF